MYHFVSYNKKTGAVTGHIVSSDNKLLPKPLAPDEAHAEITDPKQIAVVKGMRPGKTRLRGRVEKSGLRELVIESVFKGRIALSCDCADSDGDGIPELPADGTSVARVSAVLVNEAGKPLKGTDVAIQLKLTRGALSARHITTRNGLATVEVRSVPETTQTQLTASAKDFEPGRLAIELIPVKEYGELHSKTSKSHS